jgi:hypothetical protein
MRKINKTSGYWLGNDIQDRYYDPLTGLSKAPRGKDVFALSGYRNAISNFVSILTGQSIPVTFTTGHDSYTDGEQVVLSGKIDSGNFDVAVGLALHEGSHVKLTDFGHLRRGLDKYITSKTFLLGQRKGLVIYDVMDLVKNMLNVVEDRRIDRYVITNAPGYKGYYDAMYDYYFNDKIIDKALVAKVWNKPTVDNYMNHIVNFINPNRTLDLLPGLKDIWNVLDLKNIQRLNNTDDALEVALSMTDILLTNLPDVLDEDEKDKQQNPNGGGNGKEQTLLEKVEGMIQEIADVVNVYSRELHHKEVVILAEETKNLIELKKELENI